MVIFEIIALALLTGIAMLISDKDILSLGGLAIAISLIAMLWNYIYNVGFDKLFGNNRLQRKLGIRIFHTFIFEVGMLIFTLPLIMWVMDIDFYTAFIYDLGAVVFFLVYALAFNWLYDIIRHKIVMRREC